MGGVEAKVLVDTLPFQVAKAKARSPSINSRAFNARSIN